MELGQGAQCGLVTRRLARQRPEIEGLGPGQRYHRLETGRAQGGVEYLAREAAAVRHEQVAAHHRGAVPIEDVERRDRTRRRDIGRLGQLVLRHQRRDRLQVRAGDDGIAVVAQHAAELGQRERHLVRIEMLDVVAREHRIDRRRRHRRHVGHGAGDVGLHGRVDVEPDLGPVRGVEAGGGAVLALGAAADVE